MKGLLSKLTMLFAVVWMGCVDEVDFGVNPPKELPYVIDGLLTSGDTARVSISKAYPVDGRFYSAPVLGAEVRITSPEDSDMELELFITKGDGYGAIYKAKTLFVPVVGHSYQLNVKTADGVEFVSTPQRVDEAGEIESIYFEFVQGFDRVQNIEQDGFNVYVDAILPNSQSWSAQWKLRTTYMVRTDTQDCLGCPSVCWVSDREDKPLLVQSKFVGGNRVGRVFVKYVPINVQTLNDRYHIEVIQKTISNEAWEFYDGVRYQLENSSSLFQPVFSSPKGNITAVTAEVAVIGIFTASRDVRKSIFITPEDVPYKILGVFPAGPCTMFPNSTTRKPPFWN